MTQGIRPDGQIFASAATEGELEYFPAETRGWGVTLDGKDADGEAVTEPTNGIPPMEWMNGILNKLSNQVFWNLQHAIPVWTAGKWDSDAFVNYGEWIYYNASGSETSDEPGKSTGWVKIFSLAGYDGPYLKLENLLSEIHDQGSTAMSQARDNIGLGSAATLDKEYVLEFGAGIFDNVDQIPPGRTAYAEDDALNGPGFDCTIVNFYSMSSETTQVELAVSIGEPPLKMAFRTRQPIDETTNEYGWSEWLLLYHADNPPPYPVESVNGKTGAVVLTAGDVGAVPTSRAVNGHELTSDVTITASDVGAYSKSESDSRYAMSPSVAGWGGVGTYAFLSCNAAQSNGSTVAGSSLFASGVGGQKSSVGWGDKSIIQQGSTMAGTWKCCGNQPTQSGNDVGATLYYRIS